MESVKCRLIKSKNFNSTGSSLNIPLFSDSSSQLITENQNTLDSIADLNSVIAYNSATVANQIGAITLQLTNARLNNDKIQKLLDATLSTDPRAIIAQPSLITLFLGYLDKLNNLTASGFIPIVNNQTVDYQTVPLPADSLRNIDINNSPQIANINFYGGFNVNLYSPSLGYGCVPSWILGAFPSVASVLTGFSSAVQQHWESNLWGCSFVQFGSHLGRTVISGNLFTYTS